MLTVAQKH